LLYDFTLWLKGIVIFTIVADHYLSGFVIGASLGIGYHLVSIFFLLSGFGLYFSLEKLFSKTSSIIRKLLAFFSKRWLRIFPLFYVAIFIDFFWFGLGFRWWAYLGFHGIHHYWFIGLLVQCYVLAIPLFLVVKRFSVKKIFIYGLLGFIISNFIYLSYLSINNIFVWYLYNDLNFRYIGLFGLYFLLFAIGMITAKIVKNKDIILDIKLPFKRCFMLLGRHSYGIYLFHYIVLSVYR